MKKVAFISLFAALIAFALTSCDLEGRYSRTPQLYTTVFYYHPTDTTMGDTLHVTYNEDKGAWLADTIAMTDTVSFYVALNAHANNLTLFEVKYDADALWLEMKTDSIKKAVDSEQSDFENGKIAFIPGYNYACFPIRYAPRKTGVHDVTMRITSDADLESPTSELSFVQPAKDK